jgi:hypothetical protein
MAIIDRRGKPLPDNHPFKGTRIIFGGPQQSESDRESAASPGDLKGSEDVQSKTTGRRIQMAKIIDLGWAKPDDPIYSSGPMISFRPQLTESTSDTQSNTDGPQGAESSATPQKPAQPRITSAQDSAPQDTNSKSR